VVEDFRPYRDFIRKTLVDQSHLRVVCEVENGLEAVKKAQELNADLILLDIGLPGLNGIEVARQLGTVAPRSKILFLSQEASPDVVEEALKVGGKGYVLKSRAAGDLLAAIEAVLHDKQFVSSGLCRHSAEQQNGEGPTH
jgi:DNA-binding NarL/FixJ family response regulator